MTINAETAATRLTVTTNDPDNYDFTLFVQSGAWHYTTGFVSNDGKASQGPFATLAEAFTDAMAYCCGIVA